MGKQSNLEKIGFESRKEQLVKNNITKEKPYSEDNIGKGSGYGGHLHSVPQEYDELTKNKIKPQIDTENGGDSYDINGRPGVDGGRKWLQKINLYGPTNKYGIDSIDMDSNIEEGQYFIK
jgi:hypothetical protein